MKNMDNIEFVGKVDESPIEIVSWDWSIQFSEYEDPRASNYLESTNVNNPSMISDNTVYNDELEEQYWNVDIVEEYNYWKMKKLYDKGQEVSDVLQNTSPKDNKQTRKSLGETLSDDYQNLAA